MSFETFEKLEKLRNIRKPSTFEKLRPSKNFENLRKTSTFEKLRPLKTSTFETFEKLRKPSTYQSAFLARNNCLFFDCKLWIWGNKIWPITLTYFLLSKTLAKLVTFYTFWQKMSSERKKYTCQNCDQKKLKSTDFKTKFFDFLTNLVDFAKILI